VIELINTAFDSVASKEEQGIQQAKAVSEEKCSEYLDRRLKKKEVGVFDTIKCLRMRIFSSSSKKFQSKD